jgi:ABC-2 type transport system permease protein
MAELPAMTTPLPRRFHFGVLLRYRAVQLRNAADQQIKDAPLRVFIVLLLLILIWAGLYWVLREVFRQVGRFELIALVAKQQIFVHFFLVLAVMLAFSNAILAFGSLFGREEPGHLLAAPASARQVVLLKWLEGLFLSSWSFMLLGLPLMLAVAWNTEVDWFYYPLFTAHFLGFVVIPSTLGVLVAWVVAMWAPRRPLTVALWCGGLLIAAVGLWLWSALRHVAISEEWLRSFYRQLGIVQQPLLPSTWTARGVFAALERRPAVSLLYLGAVLANGAFFTWLTANIVGRWWSDAFSRAQRGRTRRPVGAGRLTSALCFVLFPYLPERMKTMMLKDLRSFGRDPTQWTQMVIMMGLLVIYAANLKRLPTDLESPGMRALIAFLNLTTVGLILATFTGRFIFPLLSLETQQLWLLGLLPTRRRDVLLVKFAFSLTMTGLSALLVMGLAIRALDLPPEWARLQLAVCLAICVGLSGLSVGLGARFPVRGQRNPARIASGFGGTLNLVASMLFVAVEVLGVGYAGLLRLGSSWGALEEPHVAAWILPSLLVFGGLVAVASLWIGIRHFEKLEY